MRGIVVKDEMETAEEAIKLLKCVKVTNKMKGMIKYKGKNLQHE